MHGFIRYLGPANGGITDESKAEYGATLKLFLAAKSLRFFADTFLTTANIEVLLGADAPELKKLKEEWYCFRILGCMQDNSQFPIMLHVKIEKFCEDELLDDGMLQTMTKSMTNIPVKLNDFQETPGQRVSDRRKAMTIDFACRKTNGCEFVSKNKTTLTNHEKKCCPKPRNLVCKMQGCKFVTLHKAALTNHVKACRGTEVVSTQEEVASPKAHTPQVVKVYACPHGSCKMTHPTKKENAEHQLTHKSTTKSPPKSTPPRGKHASNKPPVSTVDDLEPNAEQSGQEQESESDDAKKTTGTNKRNRGSSSKPQNKETEISKPTLVTKEFKCPFVDCDKSHATPDLAQYHQRKHRETASLQGPHSEIYRCTECHQSHFSRETARLHQQEHKSHATPDLAQYHQRKHRETASLQGPHSEIYRCTECHQSHFSPETARLHQQEHQSFHHRQRPTGEVETLTLCPECKLYSGTDKQVLAHIAPCRAALTCPQCSVKCDSQPHLIAHIYRCSQLADGRKRQREDTETFENEKRWKPDRNSNDRNDVKRYWRGIHVQKWLKLNELEEYQACFEKEKVDGRVLLALTEETILSPVFAMKPAHAKKFMELIIAFN